MIVSCKSNFFNEPDGNLYFSSGRSALFFFLKEYQAFFEKKITIAIQSFNCSVVIESALKAGCVISLVDIKKNDFSLDISQLKRANVLNNINAVIITHYQGIPNFEYEKIIAYARQHNMLIIEDVAQSYGSRIGKNEISTLGDIFIESYAFDKPFSCMYGGCIGFCPNNKLPLDFLTHLNRFYGDLPVESNFTAQNHIDLLAYLFKNTEYNNYKKYLNNYSFLSILLKFTRNNFFISLFLQFYSLSKTFKVLSIYRKLKIFLRFSHSNNFDSVIKLNPSKINLVKIQKKNFYCQKLPEWAARFYNSNDSKIKVCWNRFSVLDDNGEIKEHITNLFDSKIEFGNYNWPHPLHVLYKNSERVIISGKLRNSEYCSKNILNIPIWHKNND